LSVHGNILRFRELKMPDQDRFEKSIASAWRKILRLSSGGIASKAELSDACLTALAHSLRQSDGCPGLQDIADVLHGFVWDRKDFPLLLAASGSTLPRGFEALRQIEQGQGEHRATKVAARVARSILVQLSRQNDPQVSEAQLSQMRSEQTCMGLVNHHFFGCIRAYLVGERFSTFHEARAWEQAVKKAMTTGMQKLATRLWATLDHVDRLSGCLSSESL
jgi:hypothetical protein